MSDSNVNSPAHYNQTELECIDAIRYALGDEGFIAYCKGNSFKYLWRAQHKNNSIEDLKKAAWYSRMAAGDDPRKDPGYGRDLPFTQQQADLAGSTWAERRPGSMRRTSCDCRSCRGLSASHCPFQPHPDDEMAEAVDLRDAEQIQEDSDDRELRRRDG